MDTNAHTRPWRAGWGRRATSTTQSFYRIISDFAIATSKQARARTRACPEWADTQRSVKRCVGDGCSANGPRDARTRTIVVRIMRTQAPCVHTDYTMRTRTRTHTYHVRRCASLPACVACCREFPYSASSVRQRGIF